MKSRRNEGSKERTDAVMRDSENKMDFEHHAPVFLGRLDKTERRKEFTHSSALQHSLSEQGGINESLWIVIAQGQVCGNKLQRL